MPSRVIETFDHFWRRHPALLYGLSLLLGCYCSLEFSVFLLAPLAVLFFPLPFASKHLRLRLLMGFLLAGLSFLYISHRYAFPDLPTEGVAGTAQFEISAIADSRTHFAPVWVYRGIISSFADEKNGRIIARGIPVKFSFPKHADITRPPGNCAYVVEGKLKPSFFNSYTFIPDKHRAWQPSKDSWSPAELRFQAKTKVAHYLHTHIPDPRSATFLTGIATGDFNDRLMTHEFSRFGLQHIMAISGFHFAILAGILGLIFRLFLSQKNGSFLLLIFLTGYFIFIGATPSIFRAWIAITVVVLGHLVEKHSNGLNTLGIALIAIILIDPLMIQGIGFQFSFAITGAILMLYPMCEEGILQLFAKRRLGDVIRMNPLNQHAYILLAISRKAMALTLAVNILAVPMTLYYFHQFPWLGLLYNLFFPFLVSVSMLFLLLGVICPLGNAFHQMNSQFTRFLLDFTYNMPTSMDAVWRVESFPPWLLILYLCTLFWLSIWYNYVSHNHDQNSFEYCI